MEEPLETEVATILYWNKLTQSILAKASRGELVPQDPNDEPAEKLLERMRAEKLSPSKPSRLSGE